MPGTYTYAGTATAAVAAGRPWTDNKNGYAPSVFRFIHLYFEWRKKLVLPSGTLRDQCKITTYSTVVAVVVAAIIYALSSSSSLLSSRQVRAREYKHARNT